MPVGPRLRSAFRAAIFSLVALLASAVASAQDKRVLLLYDEDKTLPGLAILDESLRSTLGAGLGTSVEFFTESMNLSQFTDEQYEEVLREHYASKYRDEKLDLVVGVMGPALGFLLRHGDAAFPGVPVIFCGADAGDLQGVTLPAHVTGILLKRAFAPTLDIALRLQPETRHVVIVGGTSPFDRHLLELVGNELRAFEDRVSFQYLTELPMGDLASAVARLPPQTVILFVTFFRDGAGRAYIPHDAVAHLSEAANVPIYVFVDQYPRSRHSRRSSLQHRAARQQCRRAGRAGASRRAAGLHSRSRAAVEREHLRRQTARAMAPRRTTPARSEHHQVPRANHLGSVRLVHRRRPGGVRRADPPDCRVARAARSAAPRRGGLAQQPRAHP